MRAAMTLVLLLSGTATPLVFAQTSDWKSDSPGISHRIKPSDLPQPPASTEPEASKGSVAKVVPRPANALPKVPDGFAVQLVPDFMARLQDGAFFGWPWYYIGDHEDPAWRGKRPDLKGKVRAPEVLFQAHSSALAVAFYDRDAFPAEYRGDAFVTLHGSHTRPIRTGYKVVRVRRNGGKPTGEYQDFMTGFIVDNDTVWGRPAGIAVTRDGALLVSDDANGTVFRVARK